MRGSTVLLKQMSKYSSAYVVFRHGRICVRVVNLVSDKIYNT